MQDAGRASSGYGVTGPSATCLGGDTIDGDQGYQIVPTRAILLATVSGLRAASPSPRTRKHQVRPRFLTSIFLMHFLFSHSSHQLRLSPMSSMFGPQSHHLRTLTLLTWPPLICAPRSNQFRYEISIGHVSNRREHTGSTSIVSADSFFGPLLQLSVLSSSFKKHEDYRQTPDFGVVSVISLLACIAGPGYYTDVFGQRSR